MVLPPNDTETVQCFLDLIKLDGNTMLNIEADIYQLGQVSSASFIQFPKDKAISARELLTYWLNLSEPPNRAFCAVLGHFLSKEGKERKMQTEKLLEFASKTAEGKSEYFRFCMRERRNVLEVMADFGIED